MFCIDLGCLSLFLCFFIHLFVTMLLFLHLFELLLKIFYLLSKKLIYLGKLLHILYVLTLQANFHIGRGNSDV